jgi:ABC-type multidrug transport system fused ATPase/permease subunit
MYVAERQARKFRESYLGSVLRQNIGWFDKQGAGEISFRISSDISQIREGIGEKIPDTVANVATFAVALIVAFTRNWQLTLVLFSIVPVIALCFLFVNIFGSRFQKNVLNNYAIASSYADEALAAIRTVVAFGAQRKMAKRYDESLRDAKVEGIKRVFVIALGLGAVYFLM